MAIPPSVNATSVADAAARSRKVQLAALGIGIAGLLVFAGGYAVDQNLAADRDDVAAGLAADDRKAGADDATNAAGDAQSEPRYQKARKRKR